MSTVAIQPKTVLNVKIDADLKLKAQKIAKELGLSMSTVVSHLLRRFVKEKKITFEIL